MVRGAKLIGVLALLLLSVGDARAILRGHVLYGTVTGLDGKPIPDVTLQVLDQYNRRELGDTTSEEDGTYQIVDLPPGSWQLVAYKPGYARQEHRLELLAPTLHEYQVDIQLLAHSGDEGLKGLHLPPGGSVATKALKLREKAHRALERQDYDQALRLMEKAIEADPTFSRGYADLGTEQERRGDRVRAEELYRKALELNPKDPVPMVNLAGIRIAQGRVAEALEMLQVAMARDPRLPIGQLYQGQALVLLGRFEESLGPLKTACRLDPRGCRNAFGLLGTAYLQLESYRDARQAYERFLELDPEHKDAARIRGTILRLDELIQGRREEARRALDARFDLGPDPASE